MRLISPLPIPAAVCSLLIAVLPGALRAQGVLELQAQQAPAPSVAVAEGGTFVMTARAAGTAAEAAIALRNRGVSLVTISGVALTGSSEFSVVDLPAPPLTLQSDQSIGFRIRFQPQSSSRATARLAITYNDGVRAATFFINLAGVAPEIVVSYVLQPSGNAVLLAPGATLPFRETTVGSTATAVIIVTNRGSGPGTVRSASLTGDDFQLGGLPLLPATLDTGRELRFNILFAPSRIGPAQGRFEVSVDGAAQQFSLEGAGAGSAFQYEITTGAGTSAARPGQVIALPDTAVGQKATARVRVSNQGNAEGRVTAINVTGAAFALSDAPFLPATVPPGGSISFTLTFSPSQPGSEPGRMRVGDDTFELQGRGIGGALTFSYRSGSVSVPLANNGTILFNPLPVGKASSVTLVASNSGTAPATLTVIGMTGTASAFSLAQVPQLPLNIAPGESFELEITFAPAVLGAITAPLRLDTYAFTLSGAGAAPPSLPAYQFEGVSAEEMPMQQLNVSLSLAEPYELALTGTVTLEHGSEVFGSDPSVQFSTGGRTVAFTIPAGATRAVFQNQSEAVRLQTGSVAGVISLHPAFTVGQGVDLTPPGAAPVSIQIRPAPPKILSAAVSARAASGFTLQITGFAPTRALSRIDFEFTPAPGVSLTAPSASLNVEAAFLAWYQSQQSQQYGSMFTASIPFTLQGALPAGQSMVDGLQAVSVMLSNATGESERVAVQLK